VARGDGAPLSFDLIARGTHAAKNTTPHNFEPPATSHKEKKNLAKTPPFSEAMTVRMSHTSCILQWLTI